MTARGGLTGGLAATFCALLGFSGVHALAGRFLEERPELRLLRGSVEADKFAHFRAHGADYDLVYVGTSRVYRGFDPHAFDARMAELGSATRSYNFGLVGLGFLEELYLVDWILEHRPPSLRTLLIEPTERDSVLERANELTLRDVNWHDLAATTSGVRAAWRSERDLGQKLALTRAHVQHAAHRLCNVGVGANLLARALSEPPPSASLAAGFGVWEAAGARRDAPETRASREASPKEASPVLWEILEEFEERARAAGIRLVFVIPPTLRSLQQFEEMRANGSLPGLLLYPPRAFPELFTEHERYFYDEGAHLNAQGAELFSRRLARDVSARLQDGD